MRLFDYSTLKDYAWDSELLGLVAQVHEYKGRQELYLKQKPQSLNKLIEIAKIQSTEASNKMERKRFDLCHFHLMKRREQLMLFVKVLIV